jgi:hypothetical protein
MAKIEKCTEIGVGRMMPMIISDRTEGEASITLVGTGSGGVVHATTTTTDTAMMTTSTAGAAAAARYGWTNLCFN